MPEINSNDMVPWNEIPFMFLLRLVSPFYCTAVLSDYGQIL